MAGFWLMKSEPETWSWQNQLDKGPVGEPWDGVRNYQAANFMKAMAIGDQCFFYHSGKERAIVGIVEVSKNWYPDPADESGKFGLVDVIAKESLTRPLTLKEIKADPALIELPLIRQSRLSVMPIAPDVWAYLLSLSRHNPA